jgi:hypothetical protein
MDGGRVSAELVHALSTKLDREAWDRAWLADAYEGVQQISFLDDEIRRQVGDRLATVVVNWPRIVVDSLEERLDVEGFRAGGEQADEGLWNLWQDCDLDEWSQMGHLEALLYKQSYAIAWKDRDGLRISVESSAEVAVQALPGRSRELSAALKRWHDGTRWRAALYLPDRVETYAADGNPSTSCASQSVGVDAGRSCGDALGGCGAGGDVHQPAASGRAGRAGRRSPT